MFRAQFLTHVQARPHCIVALWSTKASSFLNFFYIFLIFLVSESLKHFFLCSFASIIIEETPVPWELFPRHRSFIFINPNLLLTNLNYLSRQMILPLERSYGESSIVTLSPGRIRIKFMRSLPADMSKYNMFVFKFHFKHCVWQLL